MKKIVIMGNSIAGTKAIEEIRAVDSESEVLLFTLEENLLPYYRHRLAGFIAQDISPDDVYYKSKEYYQKLQINTSDKKISRINLKRKRITTEDKQHVDYDLLMIADMGAEEPSFVKGSHKTGVFSLRRLADMYQVFKDLSLADTMIIQSESLSGLKMACALQRRSKEVIWIIPSKHILPSILDKESSSMMGRFLEESGIRIIEENTITEILGDEDVKAVRLKSGKVMACQMVITDEPKPDFKLFKDSDLHIRERIVVNDSFQTNINNVFALDGVCHSGQKSFLEDYDTYSSVLEQQGRLVASQIIGRTIDPGNEGNGGKDLMNVLLPMTTLSINDLPLVFIGRTQGGDSVRVFSRCDEEGRVYKKIFVENNLVIGALLFNAPQEQDSIVRLITEHLDISGREESVLLF